MCSCFRYLCSNGGKCIIIDGGFGHGCQCQAGWTGSRCQHEFNECSLNPCKNGAKCVDKFGDFQCKCKPGYMGRNCHRSCQDIYSSCHRWNRENRCRTMRKVTRFFDINCAATCKQCRFRNETVRTLLPLPPVLDPFSFLVGRWTSNSSSHLHFPVDFSADTNGYSETLDFSVAKVPMFGTPSINYSSYAKSHNNGLDVHRMFGFLTLNSLHFDGQPHDIALLSTSNNGFVLIEEGQLENQTLSLNIIYHTAHPKLTRNAPISQRTQRILSLSGPMLLVTVSKRRQDGSRSFFTKLYVKEKRYHFY